MDRMEQNLVKIRYFIGENRMDDALSETEKAIREAEKIYEHDSIFRDMLIDFLKHLIYLINEGAKEQTYDFADTIHCIPSVHESTNKDPRAYWKQFFVKYSKKYKDNFFNEYKDRILSL